MSWDTQNQTYPVIAQPESSIGAPPGSVPVNGVTVRILKDSQQDAEFAARLMVDAFRGKFVHNVTERKLPIVIKNQTARYRGQEQAFYNRILIAELDGRPVGMLELSYKGDTEIEKDDHLCELGCWHACRYICFLIVASDKVEDRSKSYVACICVDESARGKGVGKLLMQRAEYEARSRQCLTMYLHVMTTNRARNLYEREGYRVTSTTSCCGCLGCCMGPPGKLYEMEKSLVWR